MSISIRLLSQTIMIEKNEHFMPACQQEYFKSEKAFNINDDDKIIVLIECTSDMHNMITLSESVERGLK